jgi:hypothetical protein
MYLLAIAFHPSHANNSSLYRAAPVQEPEPNERASGIEWCRVKFLRQ